MGWESWDLRLVGTCQRSSNNTTTQHSSIANTIIPTQFCKVELMPLFRIRAFILRWLFTQVNTVTLTPRKVWLRYFLAQSPTCVSWQVHLSMLCEYVRFLLKLANHASSGLGCIPSTCCMHISWRVGREWLNKANLRQCSGWSCAYKPQDLQYLPISDNSTQYR